MAERVPIADKPLVSVALFSRTTPLARYTGVSEAARRIHDERIGVGHVFHLFRLPETLEQRLFEELRVSSVPAELSAALASQDAALTTLRAFCDASPTVQEGPPQVGDVSKNMTKRWLCPLAGAYSAAFGGFRATTFEVMARPPAIFSN